MKKITLILLFCSLTFFYVGYYIFYFSQRCSGGLISEEKLTPGQKLIEQLKTDLPFPFSVKMDDENASDHFVLKYMAEKEALSYNINKPIDCRIQYLKKLVSTLIKTGLPGPSKELLLLKFTSKEFIRSLYAISAALEFSEKENNTLFIVSNYKDNFYKESSPPPEFLL